MHQPNLECVHHAHGFDLIDARCGRIVFLALFGPQNDEAANDESAGHHHRCEQVGLDGLAKQQAQHHGWQESHQHIQGKLLRLFVGGQRHQRVANFLPVDQNHGKDGASLNGNVKHLGLVIIKTQQRARQNEVAGRRNRKELGQSFNDAHDGGFNQQCNVHKGS